MTDFFIYNSSGVIPDYMPGIPGYGQHGSRGDTGSAGASVYYSSFDLSKSKELTLANSCIKNKKVLSNNLDDANADEYREHDIIIDCTGTLYVLTNVDGELAISTYQSNNTTMYSSPMEHFTSLNIFCSTSFLKSSEYVWKCENPNASQTVMTESDEEGKYVYTNTSHKVRYRNKVENEIYGNYINFKLVHDSTVQDSDYTYAFVLCLPNGQCFKTISASPRCTMFIENKFVYGCFDVKSWNSQMVVGQQPLYGIANLTSETIAGGDNIFDCIKFNGVNHKYTEEAILQNIGTIADASLNNEWSKETTILCSEFIKYNCTGYVELCSKETGKMYRIDMDDIFLEKTSDSSISTHALTNIESAKDNLIWSVFSYPAHEWLSDSSTKYDMDAYVQFVIDSDKTEDEHEVDCYFVTNRNELDEQHKGALESYINNSANEFHNFTDWESWKWNDSSAGNRVIRLYFRNLDSFSLSLKYNTKASSIDASGIVVQNSYPTTMVYIGAPDCNLIQYGNNDAANMQIAVDTLTGTTGIIANCDEPGIYYLNKFIAPEVELKEPDANVMEAGLTDCTIHPKEFNLSTSEYHYIEIGLVSFSDKNGIESHMNVPKYEYVDPSNASPAYKLFADPTDYQKEILPFSIPGKDYNDELVSGKYDLSVAVYAISDATESAEPAGGEAVSYDPSDYVYKDTL